MNLLDQLRTIGIDFGLLIAGSFGSLISLKSNRALNWYEKLFTVCTGASVATYLTPVLSDAVGMSENARYGLAFLLGFMGLNAVEKLIQWMHKKMEA